MILAEDQAQRRFIRSWLLTWVNVFPRDVRDAPHNRSGSGEQFVRQQFAVEAAAHLRNTSKRGSLLIAVIDADTGDANFHYDDLMTRAATSEGIFIFVPKHCVETWLHALMGNVADETSSKYKLAYKTKLDQAIPSAGSRFLELLQTKATTGLIPSLARGIEEARRIPRLHKVPIR